MALSLTVLLELLKGQRFQEGMLVLVLLLIVLWALWAMLPEWLKTIIRWAIKRKDEHHER